MTVMPATELRRVLRGHGHAMSPIVQIGKAGVTEAFIKQMTQALADHELIKVKVGSECPIDRHEVAALLDREPGVDIVQMVGRVLLLYKRHPRTPRYEGKRADAAGPVTRPRRRGRRSATGSSGRKGGRPGARTRTGARTGARASKRK